MACPARPVARAVSCSGACVMLPACRERPQRKLRRMAQVARVDCFAALPLRSSLACASRGVWACGAYGYCAAGGGAAGGVAQRRLRQPHFGPYCATSTLGRIVLRSVVTLC